jgi:hypothetical protein
MRISILAAAALLLGGCAAILEGQTQTMTFDVLPREAVCAAARNGHALGTVTAEAPTITLRKEEAPVLASCSAPGYRDQIVTIHPDLSPLGVLTAPVDYPAGTIFRYPERVVVTLRKSG